MDRTKVGNNKVEQIYVYYVPKHVQFHIVNVMKFAIVGERVDSTM